MIYIGIDPGAKKNHAYSIWRDGRPVDWGKIENIMQFYDITSDGISKDKVEVLIEDQYLHNNYKTSKALTFRSGQLAGICELLGVKFDIINVATWTSRWGGYKGIEKGLSAHKKKKFKATLLIDYVMDHLNLDIKDEDEASAVLIPYIMRIR